MTQEKIFLVSEKNLLDLLKRVYGYGVEDKRMPIPKNQKKLKEQGLMAQISCLEKVEFTKEKLTELLLESLSDLEHKQWEHWRKYIEQKFNIPKSDWLLIDYKDLPEKIKEQDRVWARKVIDIIFKKLERI